MRVTIRRPFIPHYSCVVFAIPRRVANERLWLNISIHHLIKSRSSISASSLRLPWSAYLFVCRSIVVEKQRNSVTDLSCLVHANGSPYLASTPKPARNFLSVFCVSTLYFQRRSCNNVRCCGFFLYSLMARALSVLSSGSRWCWRTMSLHSTSVIARKVGTPSWKMNCRAKAL